MRWDEYNRNDATKLISFGKTFKLTFDEVIKTLMQAFIIDC